MRDPLSRLNRSESDENSPKKREEDLQQAAVETSPEPAAKTQEIDETPVVDTPHDNVGDLRDMVNYSQVMLKALLEEDLIEASPSKIQAWFDNRYDKFLQLSSFAGLDEDADIDDAFKARLFDAFLASVQSYKLNSYDPAQLNKDEKPHDDIPLVRVAREKIAPLLMDRIDAAAAATLSEDDLRVQIEHVVYDLLLEQNLQLNKAEQTQLVDELLDDMLGFGPLESLLDDPLVTDIMVNGYNQIYIERKGKLELSSVKFRNDAHVMSIATRIVTLIGRRIDETSPLCDARLPDGSRVNIIIPPLALDGPSISIRKFPKHGITLDVMARQGNISENMATVLKIAARSRLNILISGGTGSGKTTSLNAMSQMIDHGERVVTIEDAAELQLQQPHVVRLETRPPNLEGEGEITMRDLVKNSLRMRPDRVILGEIRGSEAVDMLQAMNTGHDGSLCTIHANNPREALTRLENMVGMAGINLPAKAVRTQIASAIDMIIQVSRMRDGMRRITYITEIVGMEGDVVITQDLFKYEFEGEGDDGKLKGAFKSSQLRPAFIDKANYFGLEKALLAAME